MSSELSKEEERLQKKLEADAKKSFSVYTIQLFGLNKIERCEPSTKNLDYSIDQKIKFLKKSNSKALNRKRIKPALIDRYIYSENLNSVIGIDGLKILKEGILNHVAPNIEEGEIKINNSFFNDLLYRSGVYLEYENAPSQIVDMYEEYDHRASHRAVLLNTQNPNLKKMDLMSLNIILGRYNKEVGDYEFKHFLDTLNITTSFLEKKFEKYLQSEQKLNLDYLLKTKKSA